MKASTAPASTAIDIIINSLMARMIDVARKLTGRSANAAEVAALAAELMDVAVVALIDEYTAAGHPEIAHAVLCKMAAEGAEIMAA